jgi:non-heme chloroperoxidase
MPFIHSSLDGTLLHYVDYRPVTNPPPFQTNYSPSADCNTDTALIFIHGWPMSHQMYEHLMVPLCENHRVRCIASDRRGFGKSDWSSATTTEVTYDTFAQDTIDIVHSAGPQRFLFVASSMGCGESLLAYLKMPADLQSRCLGFLWLGPSLPYPLATEANPSAPSRELWDMILAGFRQDRVGFTRTAMPGVFGIPFNIGVEVPETVLHRFEGLVAQADALALERCIQIITNKDLTEDLRMLDGRKVRLVVIHGDNDQSKKLVSHVLSDMSYLQATPPAQLQISFQDWPSKLRSRSTRMQPMVCTSRTRRKS